MKVKAWIQEEVKNSPSIVATMRWYKGLNRKQQILVKIALSMFCSFVVFSSLVSSGVEKLDIATQNYMKSEALYQSVSKNVATLKALSNQPTGFIDRPSNELQGIVASYLQKYSIEPEAISNIGSSKVSLEFVDVAFKELSTFIQSLEEERVGIESFYVEPKTNGDVDFSIILD